MSCSGRIWCAVREAVNGLGHDFEEVIDVSLLQDFYIRVEVLC